MHHLKVTTRNLLNYLDKTSHTGNQDVKVSYFPFLYKFPIIL